MSKVIAGLGSAFLVLCSVFAATFQGESCQYCIWEPNLHVELNPDSSVIRGIFGSSQFTTNKIGLRGDDLKDQEIRMITIGGSTMECGYLDDKETWPYLLQEKLAAKTQKSAWVGNAGRSGMNSRHHILQMEKLFDQIKNIDLAIILIGVNDAGLLVDNYNPAGLDDPKLRKQSMDASFRVLPADDIASWIKASIRSLRRMLLGDTAFMINKATQTGIQYKGARERRKRARKVAIPQQKLELLPAVLDEYKRNIESMIRLCNRYRVRPLFLTQPSLYQLSLPPEDEALLWGGVVDHNEKDENAWLYATVAELKRIMGEYNRVLLETARANDALVLDLDAVVSPSWDVFYDDVHFTEKGARIVADAVAEFVCRQGVFPCEVSS